MAEVKLKISAEDKASAVIEKMKANGVNASDRLSTAFDQLNVKSTGAYEKMRQSAQGAYDKIKNSGVATSDELIRAEEALAAKMATIDEEQMGRRAALLKKQEALRIAAADAEISRIEKQKAVVLAAAQAEAAAWRAQGYASPEIGKAYQELGIKSSAAFDLQRKSASSAYDAIKNSGVTTAAELTRAGAAHAAKMTAIDEEQFGKRTSLLQKFKANWLGATAAIGAAWIAASQAWNLAELGAKGLQQRESFGNLAASKGFNADAIIADLKRVSGETVATQKLIEQAGTSMLLGVEGKMLPKLMEISRAASRITGQTITESFGSLSLGIARQSKLLLDNLGIMIDVEKANDAYAKANHKTAAALTDTEKKQAFMNATVAIGQEMIDAIGVSGMTAMEKLQRVGATMENLKEVAGRGVLATFSLLQGSFQGTAAAALMLSSGIFKLISASSALVGAKDAAQEYQQLADAAFESSIDLATKAKDSITGAWDLMSGKMDPVNAKLAEYQQKIAAQKLADAEAAQEKIKLADATKAAESSLSAYSKSLDDLGRQQLKIAESGFNKDLERQEEYFKKNAQAAANLGAPIRSYLAVLDQVYGAQETAQEGIYATLVKIGANQQARLQQEINIKNVEKTSAEERLKGWTTYYDKLKNMHATAMETMQAKQEAALAVQKSGAEFKQSLDDKFFPVDQLNTYDQLFAGLEKADRAYTQALQASGPQKAAALQSAMDLLKNLPTEVREGDKIIVSSFEVYDQVISRFNKMQAARQDLADSEAAAAKAAAANIAAEMLTAQDAMRLVGEEVSALDSKIAAMNKVITLTMPTDQVNDSARRVQGYLDALQDKTITITANYVSNLPSSFGGLPTAAINDPFGAIPQYASGTPYVPRTGLALIHQGERIIPASENRPGANGGNQTITIAPVIQISGVSPSGAEKTARELARELEPELRKLATRYR